VSTGNKIIEATVCDTNVAITPQKNKIIKRANLERRSE
jgi:hypothetical protein